MQLKFLGTESVVPTVGQDSPSSILGESLLVDCGWHPLDNLHRSALDPMALRWLFLTHCHLDHYLGLPQLLFYLRMSHSRRPDRPPLRILGPDREVQLVVERSRHFLRVEQFPDTQQIPEVTGLADGDTVRCAELEVTCHQTVHPIPSLCYRFTSTATGRSVAITGDTAYHLPVVDHVAGVDLLVHESAAGATEPDPLNPKGHSGAVQAARIAKAAGVGTLALVHWRSDERDAVLAAARAVFPRTIAPLAGERFIVPP